jgi:hypothetical protein
MKAPRSNAFVSFLFYAILAVCLGISAYLRFVAPPPIPQHLHQTAPAP